MGIIDEVKNHKRVSVPLIGIASADQVALVDTLRGGLNGSVPIIRHDIVKGAVGMNDLGREAVQDIVPPGTDAALATGNVMDMLVLAEKLAASSILIMSNAHRWLEQPGASQALQNLREPFKSDGRMVILLGPSIDLPVELIQDFKLLDDPLPDSEAIGEIIGTVLDAAGLSRDEQVIKDASEALIGLSAFSAEQACALALSKKGLNKNQCWNNKRKMVEQTKGLSMPECGISYADIGGLSSIKDDTRAVFGGPCAPKLLVQMEEIEKLLAGAGAAGGPGDSSGTSQDQLQVLLDTIESNGWLGALYLGPPGSGKSFFSQAVAGEFGIKRILFDLGAMKGSLVGQSEGQIRAAMKTIKAIGDGSVMVVGTCNKLESLPPELRRRFNSLGMWFFDLPDRDEKAAIWRLQMAKFSIADQPLPDDTGWSSANIRDCCRSAYIKGRTLLQAAVSVVSATAQDPEGIERLRRMAAGRFLSASYPGAYRLPVGEARKVQSRSITSFGEDL